MSPTLSPGLCRLASALSRPPVLTHDPGPCNKSGMQHSAAKPQPNRAKRLGLRQPSAAFRPTRNYEPLGQPGRFSTYGPFLNIVRRTSPPQLPRSPPLWKKTGRNGTISFQNGTTASMTSAAPCPTTPLFPASTLESSRAPGGIRLRLVDTLPDHPSRICEILLILASRVTR